MVRDGGVVIQVVAPKELVADEEYDEILEDMREECGKYGELLLPHSSSSRTTRGVFCHFVLVWAHQLWESN